MVFEHRIVLGRERQVSEAGGQPGSRSHLDAGQIIEATLLVGVVAHTITVMAMGTGHMLDMRPEALPQARQPTEIGHIEALGEAGEGQRPAIFVANGDRVHHHRSR